MLTWPFSELNQGAMLLLLVNLASQPSALAFGILLGAILLFFRVEPFLNISPSWI
jgi:hypothetical protein